MKSKQLSVIWKAVFIFRTKGSTVNSIMLKIYRKFVIKIKLYLFSIVLFIKVSQIERNH